MKTLSRKIGTFYCLATWVSVGMFWFSSETLLQADFQKGYDEVKPILKKYCYDCHDNKKHKGGLNFETFKVEKDILVHLQQWFSVIDQVETSVMPPEEKKLQPSAAERIKLVSWARETIDEFDYESVKDPGKYNLRRLTRAEYNNTVRDLTGVDLNPARYFSGYGGGGEGFDNNAEGMSTSPMMVEKYFQAARDISRHAGVSYTGGINFGPELSPTNTPAAYQVLAERKLTNFYNDFFDKLPKYNPRKDFEPYIMPAMKLALANPKASDRDIYDTAIKKKLRPGVFYKWATSFINAEEDSKSKRWDSHYGHWVIDPWLKFAKKESFTASELQQVHDDFAAKATLSIPATGMMIKPSMEVKKDLKENAEILYLSVGDMGDGHEFDHIVLHNPRVTLKDGKVVYLGDLELIEKQGEGKIHTEKFPDGKPFTSSASKKIEHGFYIEAPALLSFKLPAGAKTFNATMGMEKSADGKGSVQAYASEEKIPFPEGKHAHSYFYSGPSHVSVEAAKKWWVIYSSLIGYGKGAGSKEMIDVSLDKQAEVKLASIRREAEYAKREPIQKFLAFAVKKGGGNPLILKSGAFPTLSLLPGKDRIAPEKLSQTDKTQWSVLKKDAEAFQTKIDKAMRAHYLSFAAKAFRRPIRKEEAQMLDDLYNQSIAETDNFQKAGQMVVQSLLTHPQFLFRFEKDNHGDKVQLVDDYAMANRLSYFLWSSMPDETLLNLAKEGRLQDEKVLELQVRRMLKDPRSISLAQEFASQWLGFRKILAERKPDPKLFPSYTKELQEDMYQESVLVFDDLVKQDKSVFEILDSKSTFLNESLAKHYGIEGVKGEQMRKVELKNDQRGGFLSMGSMLVATSFPSRTSPVNRGQWVLDALTGGKVPPPPESVDIDDAILNNKTLTKKQRLAEHRNNPNCSVCHDRMDPLGFALENYDAIGRFRSKEKNGQVVDAVGELKGGQKLQGVKGLKEYITNTKSDAFLHQIAQKNLGFSLGRSLKYYDESVIREAVANLKKNDNRFSELAIAIVKSYPFRYKRGKGYITDAK